MRQLFHFIAIAASVVGSYCAPQVKIGQSMLAGRDVTGLKQDFFGGIPFAEPPLGNLRLKPPVLKTSPDSATFNASNFGPVCLQPVLASEDCLTINVFRPSNLEPGAKLPVVRIETSNSYGGGFQGGASALYNGSLIVAQAAARGTPLIYVNFNYRLGPLGFPQGTEAAKQGALNLALKDELTALEWVQHNIEAFGGDKTKVTVFGESAGAIMNSVLFLNSGLEKLARGAILESGSQATSINFGAARRQGNWDNFVAGVASCSSLATTGNTFNCLRQANSTEIFNGLLAAISEAPEEFGFDPTIDGPGGLYPDIPSRLFANGHFARLPFIAGTNLDEGTLFIPPTVNSEDQLREFIIANFSPPIVQPEQLENAATKLLQLYPDVPALGSPFNTGNNTFGLSSEFKRAAALQGDRAFQSQRRFWQQTAANAGVKTWGYLFTQPQPQSPPFLGTTHGSEVNYVYGAPTDQSASSLRISGLMIDYWVSFATSLTPNDGKGLKRPEWEQYTPRNKRLIQLNGDNTAMIDDDYRKEQIGFINSVPAVFLHRRGL
ncbi:Lipase 2 [Leucoagaricus sp. SymC.cos]|nr:Lipase 2 [Leucoagaricus sp. SymC.cos]